mmetsp:Transcript_18823/g.66518  ORF Transcript_18823/g.66518 Transcript_18823/m.66518 type:complete len:268 (-) Transcript_18823:263-1066(-)
MRHGSHTTMLWLSMYAVRKDKHMSTANEMSTIQSTAIHAPSASALKPIRNGTVSVLYTISNATYRSHNTFRWCCGWMRYLPGSRSSSIAVNTTSPTPRFFFRHCDAIVFQLSLCAIRDAPDLNRAKPARLTSAARSFAPTFRRTVIFFRSACRCACAACACVRSRCWAALTPSSMVTRRPRRLRRPRTTSRSQNRPGRAVARFQGGCQVASAVRRLPSARRSQSARGGRGMPPTALASFGKPTPIFEPTRRRPPGTHTTQARRFRPI